MLYRAISLIKIYKREKCKKVIDALFFFFYFKHDYRNDELKIKILFTCTKSILLGGFEKSSIKRILHFSTSNIKKKVSREMIYFTFNG